MRNASRGLSTVDKEPYLRSSAAPFEPTGALGHQRPLRLCSGLHITERKTAEEEIRARQQALVTDLTQRALADPDPYALMDEAVILVARTMGVECARQS
ncbi:MAG: hypothetical protein H0X71_09320 [Rubrobacter sp.]|nr:hypothetical protein [Rubrobacter sp.]